MVSDWNATAESTLLGDPARAPQESFLYLGFVHAAIYAVVGVYPRYAQYRWSGRAPTC